MSGPIEQDQVAADVYVAGASTDPDAGEAADAAASLDDLEAEVLTTRLASVVRELGAYAEGVADSHSGDTEPAPVELMEAICEAPDADLVYGSLARRVRAGTITWQQVWQEPREHDGGLRLLGDVLAHQTAGRVPDTAP